MYNCSPENGLSLHPKFKRSGLPSPFNVVSSTCLPKLASRQTAVSFSTQRSYTERFYSGYYKVSLRMTMTIETEFTLSYRRDALENALRTRPQTVYAGVDPTAKALHIGHLVPLMCLLHFQVRGHRIIPLVSVFIISPPKAQED